MNDLNRQVSPRSNPESVVETPQWFVAYTYPRHERAVADQLDHKSVETFLPTFIEISQWRDRRVSLEVPLFPGYVFARIAERERVKVLSVPSVVRMLSYRQKLAPVSDDEINTIKLCISRKVKLRRHPFIAIGDLVRVREGVFEGLQGIVVRENNRCKLVVSIGLIQSSVAMEIDARSLEYVGPPLASIEARPAGHALASTTIRSAGTL